MLRDDPSGKQFGYWTVVRFSHRNKRGELYWNCKCRCGTERAVKAPSLRSGRSTSCGCYHLEAVTTHGMTESRTFVSWHTMLQRSQNPNSRDYHSYGGRGIKVCKRWQASFENFLADMGERPDGKTLDRKDVNGDYEPDNCRWATPSEQQRNRRDSRLFTFDGKTLSIAGWADLTGTPRGRISERLAAGWSIEKAVLQPSSGRGPKPKAK